MVEKAENAGHGGGESKRGWSYWRINEKRQVMVEEKAEKTGHPW